MRIILIIVGILLLFILFNQKENNSNKIDKINIPEFKVLNRIKDSLIIKQKDVINNITIINEKIDSIKSKEPDSSIIFYADYFEKFLSKDSIKK